MRPLRPVVTTLLGAGLLAGMTGCDGGVPATGSRAVVSADRLERQRDRLEQIRAGLKTRSATKAPVRR